MADTFATPTAQQVLERRRRRNELGPQTADLRHLPSYLVRDLVRRDPVITGQRAIDLIERVSGERQALDGEARRHE